MQTTTSTSASPKLFTLPGDRDQETTANLRDYLTSLSAPICRKPMTEQRRFSACFRQSGWNSLWLPVFSLSGASSKMSYLGLLFKVLCGLAAKLQQ